MNRVINLGRFFSTHPLSREEPLKAWTRFLGWQIKSRLQKEVVFRWIGGQSLVVRRGMTGATGNVYVGLHEFADMMMLLHFLREGDLFLDIGANVGSYTVLGSGVCRAHTWAFEPDPITAENLRRNVAINALESLVTIHECALGPEFGNIGFTTGLDTMNKVAEAGREFRIVRQEPLDTIIGDAAPIMMKIDVEGYEDAVLAGASEVLSKPSLKIIEIETVTSETKRLLTSHVFERMFYSPFTRTLDAEPSGPKSSNSLYVRDLSFVQQRLAEGPTVEVLNHLV